MKVSDLLNWIELQKATGTITNDTEICCAAFSDYAGKIREAKITVWPASFNEAADMGHGRWQAVPAKVVELVMEDSASYGHFVDE